MDTTDFLIQVNDARNVIFHFFQYIYNLICGILLLIEIRINNNLKPIYERYANSFDKIGSAYVIPFIKFHLVKDPNIMKNILVHYRNDPEGFFGRITDDDIGTFVKITQMYMLESDSTPNDYILGSQKEFSKIYRKFLLQMLSRSTVKSTYLIGIKEITSSFVNKWFVMQETTSTSINFSKEIRYLVCTMISKLIIGWHPENSEDIQQLADSIDLINKMAAEKIIGTKVDKNKLQLARHIIKVAIESALNNPTTKLTKDLIDLELEGTFTRTQSKLMLCTLFMTGQETSVTALIEVMWHLTQNKHIQDYIVDDITAEKVIIEGLRTKSPAYIIPRHTRVPLHIKNYGNIYPHETIVLCPFLAANDPQKYKNPSTFDPNRHSDRNKIEWLPFGDKAHRCPGSDFYFAEAITLVTTIIHDYYISTTMKEKPTSAGMITEHFTTDLFINLKKK